MQKTELAVVEDIERNPSKPTQEQLRKAYLPPHLCEQRKALLRETPTPT